MVTMYFFCRDGCWSFLGLLGWVASLPFLSFFLFALAHFRSLPLAWWFCISALRGFSCSSVAVILLLLMKYVLRHVREKKKKYFYKSINISLCDKYFYKNKKSKLSFGDRVAVQNDILFKYGGSTRYSPYLSKVCF